jgi:hypothetical protein
MLLKTYMTNEGVTPEALAQSMKGKASVSAIIKWMWGERTPRPDQLRLIFKITHGSVTPNDFVLEKAPKRPTRARVAA